MSQKQTQAQPNQKAGLTQKQLRSLLKKKFLSQMIGQTEYIYSLLEKKNEKFILSNERFLILKGVEYIAYARNLPEDIELPFKSEALIPQLKMKFTIKEIQNVTSQKEALIINFLMEEKKVKWQFACLSKGCATEWRRKIQIAIENFKQYEKGKFQKYEDYVKDKQGKLKEIKSEETVANQLIKQENKKEMQKLQALEQKTAVQLPKEALAGLSSIPPVVPQEKIQQSQPIKEVNAEKSQKQIQIQRQSESRIKQEPKPENTGPKRISNVFKDSSEIKNSQIRDQSLSQSKSVTKPISTLFQGAIELKEQPIQQKKHEEKHQNNDEKTVLETQKTVQNYVLEPLLKSKEKIKDSKAINIYDREKFAKNKDKSQVYETYNDIIESPKKNVQNLKRNWIQELMKGISECQLIIDFKNYIQKIVQTIVDEFGIDEKDRTFKLSFKQDSTLTYELDDVNLQFYLYHEDNILQNHPKYKNARKIFKNYDYLMQITRNRTSLRVPLMVIFQYKGFVGMAKTKFSNIYQNKYDNQQFSDLYLNEDFEEVTRISNNALRDQQKFRITAYTKNKMVNSISIKSKVSDSNTKIFVVDQVNSYLPIDRFSNKQKDPNKILRAEFIQDEQFQDFIFDEYKNNDKTEQVFKSIPQRIERLVAILESQEQYFANSKQFSNLMHSTGLNMRYIGLVYKMANQAWLKDIIMSQILARCIKNYFRYDLQDCILNLRENLSKTKENQYKAQVKRVVSFLNLFLGKTQNSQVFWNSLNEYAAHNFNCSTNISRNTSYNFPYLIQAIQNSCSITLSSKIISNDPSKKSNNIKIQDFLSFNFSCKIYNLDFSHEYEEINEYLENQSQQSFQRLKRCLNLGEQGNYNFKILDQFRSNQMYQKIINFLTIFIPPNTAKQLYFSSRNSEKLLPSRLLYETRLTQLKWSLKKNEIEEVNRLRDWIFNHAQRWFGDIHPVYVQLFDTLATYYSTKGQGSEKGITYCKKNIEILQIMMGRRNGKVSEQYYLLGEIYEANHQNDEALKYLYIAKQILDQLQIDQLEDYALLCLKISKIHLQTHNMEKAFEMSMSIFNKTKESLGQRMLPIFLQNLQIIDEYYLNFAGLKSYCIFLQSSLHHLTPFFIDDPEQFQKIIKIIIYPQIKQITHQKSNASQKLINLLSHLKDTLQDHNASFEYLKARAIDRLFPQTFIFSLRNTNTVFEQIEKNQMIQRWKGLYVVSQKSMLNKIKGSQINRGFDFIATLCALKGFFADSFLEQILHDSN